MVVIFIHGPTILALDDVARSPRACADLVPAVAEVVNFVRHDLTSAAWTGNYNRDGFRSGSADIPACRCIINPFRIRAVWSQRSWCRDDPWVEVRFGETLLLTRRI